MLLEATESGGDEGISKSIELARTLNPWQKILGISLHDGIANPHLYRPRHN